MEASILLALMSPDNSVRGSAEQYFNGLLESTLLPTIQSLITVFADQSVDLTIRSFSGILLRRALEVKTAAIEPAVMDQMRGILVAFWGAESNPLILKRLSHVLAQSATAIPWPTLLPTIIGLGQSDKPSSCIISLLNLVEIITDYCPGDIQSNLSTLGGMLATHIVSTDAKVQVACARATAACIVALDDDNARNAFRPALGPVINVIGEALSRGDEADATSIIENLVSVVQMQPLFLKGAVDQVVAAMLTIVAAASLEFTTRSMALELMVTLTETAPALARRCTALVQGLIPLGMNLMLEYDVTEGEWVRERYSEDPLEGDYVVGEEAINRVCAGMGGRVVAPVVLGLVEQFSKRPEWSYRRAAVSALAALAAGCAPLFEKSYLDISQQFLLQSLADASPIVRFEAEQTIGLFAQTFPEKISSLVEAFVPPLTALLGEASVCERVRGNAAAALIQLLNPESCEADALKPHLDALLRSLVTAMQTLSVHVQSPCLQLLGCVAQVAEEGFEPYYSSFMPGIKAILTSATSAEQAIVRGKAMECAGLLGEAVGVKVFAADALELMTLFARTIEVDKENDVVFDYILPACARIANAVGPQFEPFLPIIMAPLLAAATQTIQFNMEDADESDTVGELVHDEETGTETTVIALNGGAKKRISLNTHAVQQKNQAARMLYEFSKSMQGYLKGYLIPCLTALLNMVTDKHSADVRSSSSLALAKLFEGILDATEKSFMSPDCLPEVLAACLGKLLESLKGEINPTSRACAAECLRDVLQACYLSGPESPDGRRGAPACLPDNVIAVGILQELLHDAGDSLARRQAKVDEFEANEGLEEEDKEVMAEDLEEEEDLLSNLVDAMGMLLKLYGNNIMSQFDRLITPVFAPFLEHPSEGLRSIAVCMLDDVIEFGGAAARKYVPSSLGVFVRNMGSEHQVLRQSSVYGIAQCLRHAQEECVAHLPMLIPALLACINSPQADEEDYEGTKENALFALGTICHSSLYRASAWGTADASQVANTWLTGLPLRADELESKIACSQLCDGIEKGDPLIVGECYRNIAQLLRIIADVLIDASTAAAASAADSAVHEPSSAGASSLAHPATIARMQSIVRQVMGGGVSPDVLTALSGAQQTAIRQVM